MRNIMQGDHVSQIAAKEGFGDYLRLWNLPENEALSKLRNPNVLFPGDKLFVPELESKVESVPSDSRHRFLRFLPKLKLNLYIRNVDGEPAADTEGVLSLDTGESFRVITDDKGFIEQDIAPIVKKARLAINEFDIDFEMRIGDLDPVQETSGVRARLNNLGYFSGYDSDETEQLTWAIEEFQMESGITPTGAMDAATESKLVEVHGV